jgi:type I restriction enzyme S subunit
MIETPYGSFPDDYHLDELEDLCVKKIGIQTGPFGSQLHNSDYVSVGIPILTVEHLGENRILHENLPRVTEADRQRLARYSIIKGDIIFSRVGSVDRRALVRDEEDGWLFSGRCLRVRPDPEKLDSIFLSYLMGLPSFQEYIRKIAVGATMPSINTEILNRIPVCYPPLSTQHAIARNLGSLDDKIELNRQMNETLEAMARAIFQSWFVDFDPVRAKAEGRDTGLPPEVAALFPSEIVKVDGREVPSGWKIGKVSDLGKIICGKTPPTKDQENYGTDMLFITIPDMHNQIFVLNTNKMLSNTGVEIQSNKTLPPMSICVSCIASPGLVSLTTEPSQTNQQINSIVTFDENHIFYCYFALIGLSDEIKSSGSGGSVIDNLNKGEFSALSVLIPSEKVLENYHYQVNSLFLKILINQKESRTLAQIRDAILPKLMSGGIQLSP